MLLIFPILFLNSVTSQGIRAIGDPFTYPSKRYIYNYENFQENNFVFFFKVKDEMTGNDEMNYQYCTKPNDTEPHHPIMASSQFIHPEQSVTIDEVFIWKCVKTRENGKYSAEPFRCVYKAENGTNVEMMAGESSQTNNGSIKHYCDIANGGLRRVTEYVLGCYHNGTVYTVDETWEEENPGDKNSSQRVKMGCRRGESGHFEKKVLGCIITKSSKVVEYLENGSSIVTNETYTYIKYMKLNEVEILSYSEDEDRELERCVETEPGHVAVVKATEEEVGCTYKNEFHKYDSYWEDHEMGAVLKCEHDNKIEKKECLVNGTEYYLSHSREHKLSNGCTFICHEQKNIYKCPDQLSFMEVMKTATTKIPTTLRAELGF
ncbi:unnamed protein product [Caenorhabditis brenneri]